MASKHSAKGKLAGVDTEIPNAYEVFRWPEFEAFAKRLGISFDVLTQGITIEMTAPDKPIKVIHHYFGEDATKRKPCDTSGIQTPN